MTTEKKPRQKKDDIPFEQRLARLQEIIALLEKGNIPLQESLNLYKEGLEHSKLCQELIDSAQHEIKILQGTELLDFQVKE